MKSLNALIFRLDKLMLHLIATTENKTYILTCMNELKTLFSAYLPEVEEILYQKYTYGTHSKFCQSLKNKLYELEKVDKNKYDMLYNELDEYIDSYKIITK